MREISNTTNKNELLCKISSMCVKDIKDYKEYESFIYSLTSIESVQAMAINFKQIKDTEYGDIEKVIMHKIQDYLYCKDFSSRRIFYVDHECVSNVQILIQDSKLSLNAYLRSSDINRLLLNDLSFLAKLYLSVYAKCVHLYNSDIDVSIQVFVSCPHEFINYTNVVEIRNSV